MDPGHGPILSVRDLRVTFAVEGGIFAAVDGVDLTLHRGQTLALVGESGSGKSALSLSLLGLIDAPGRVAAGSITLGDPSAGLRAGVDLTQAEEHTLRQVRGNRIAMVFQEPGTALNPVMRVGDQVAEPLRVHRALGPAEARRRALRVLSEVGVPFPEERYGSFPHELSGGLRQRVLIAMALVCEPDVLIADEPTTAVDVTIQQQIVETLCRLQRSRHMATLFVTHDLSLVETVAHRVAVMYAGRIVEEDDAESLMRRPRHPYTRALWQANPAHARPGRPLPVIPGGVPGLANRPCGCAFHPRCNRAVNNCHDEAPPFADGVACFAPYDEALA